MAPLGWHLSAGEVVVERLGARAAGAPLLVQRVHVLAEPDAGGGRRGRACALVLVLAHDHRDVLRGVHRPAALAEQLPGVLRRRLQAEVRARRCGVWLGGCRPTLRCIRAAIGYKVTVVLVKPYTLVTRCCVQRVRSMAADQGSGCCPALSPTTACRRSSKVVEHQWSVSSAVYVQQAHDCSKNYC